MRRTRLSSNQRRALAVLAPGGLLTLAQISRNTGVPRVPAALAVSALRRAGLIRPGGGLGPGRYAITSDGRARLAAAERAEAAL